MDRHLSRKKPDHLLSIALTIAAIAFWATAALAFDPVNTTFFGVAIKGYDTVAYHTRGQAIKGDSRYAFEWNDAKWYFSTAANRDLFAGDPERYAPQYGGY